MKNLSNVEKSGFRKGEYIAYLNGAKRVTAFGAVWKLEGYPRTFYTLDQLNEFAATWNGNPAAMDQEPPKQNRVYVIQGHSAQGWEDMHRETEPTAARQQLATYRGNPEPGVSAYRLVNRLEWGY